MRVRISTISPGGLPIRDTIPARSLNARMTEGRQHDFVFIEDPLVEVTLYHHPNGAESKGKVTGRYQQRCGRCTLDVPREIEARLDYILKPKPEGRSWEDDVGIAYYDNDHIELEDLVQEALILSLDVFWSPPLKADGSCTHCNKQESEVYGEEEATQSLGDLLKRASEKKSRR